MRSCQGDVAPLRIFAVTSTQCFEGYGIHHSNYVMAPWRPQWPQFFDEVMDPLGKAAQRLPALLQLLHEETHLTRVTVVIIRLYRWP